MAAAMGSVRLLAVVGLPLALGHLHLREHRRPVWGCVVIPIRSAAMRYCFGGRVQTSLLTSKFITEVPLIMILLYHDHPERCYSMHNH